MLGSCHILKSDCVAAVGKIMFMEAVGDSISCPGIPFPRHAPCVSEISVGKPVKHVISSWTPLYFPSNHEGLQAYSTCVVAGVPAVSLCVCVYVHVTLK